MRTKRTFSQAQLAKLVQPNYFGSKFKKAKIYPTSRQVSGRLAELKNFDTALAFDYDATGEVPATGQLALIPQGDTANTRDGRQCVVKSIHIKGQAYYTPATHAVGTVPASSVHMFLVHDKQCNKAAAAYADVLDGANGYNSLPNLDNQKRFRILKKWMIPFGPTGSWVGTATLPMQVIPVEYYHKCSIPINFTGTSGAIGTIESDNLFLLAVADGNTDDLISFAGTCRLRFLG